MELFDTHAHYYDGRFDSDREEVVSALPEAGVKLVLCPGCDLPSSRACVELAERYPYVYAAVGVHPEDCAGWKDTMVEEVRALTAIPMDRILIETDTPYMAPEPFSGRRNDSRYVYRMAETVAQVKGLTSEEAAAATFENGKWLFHISNENEA